jgi:diaminopimelate decarboxylase
MSARAPVAIEAAAHAAEGPVLLYDLAAIAARIAAMRAAAQASRVGVLAAVKAVAIAPVLALAASSFDGLDVAGPDEDAAVTAHRPAVVSVTYPGGATAARLHALVAPGRRVVVSCETAAQVAAAAAVPGVELVLRVSSSALGEVAPGGLRDADGDHVSRFGVEVAALRALAAVAPGRVRGLHVHGGALATSPARLAARAVAALAAAEAAGLTIERLDVGGSLHGFALDAPTAGQATVAAALAALRAAVPAGLELCVEPGRVLTEGCGYAAGRVLVARSIGGLDARVLALSRLCHLRWSTPRLCAPPPTAADRQRLVLVGATCCEDDVLGDAVVPAAVAAALGEGALAIVAGVSGYAAAWNRGFAGVPAASVITVG